MLDQQLICVNCESDNIEDLGEAENERPNGDKMHLYDCNDCQTVWKE